MVVLVGFLAGPVGVVPDELVIFVELMGFGQWFDVVFFVEHVGWEGGLDVIVLEGRLGWVLDLVLLIEHYYYLKMKYLKYFRKWVR